MTKTKVAPTVELVSGQSEVSLEHGWELISVSPGLITAPEALAGHEGSFRAAIVPGTVALALEGEGQIEHGDDIIPLDGWDHWYRCRFARPSADGARTVLCFDGLATLADIWLNGFSLGSSENMFEAHAFDVSAILRDENELCIRFRALLPVLHAKHARGRFPTRFVSERNLRFVRTTLLGYIAGFGPATRPVGPWRAVRVLVQSRVSVESVQLHAHLEGDTGVLDATVYCRVFGDVGRVGALINVGGGRAKKALAAGENARGVYVLRGRVEVERARPWWPHTHGDPALYDVSVELMLDGAEVKIALGRVGFRALALVSNETHGFAIRINGQVLFCRGACWTPLDIVALHAKEAALRTALLQVRDAGMNMVRVLGTMVYESDAFYRLCDELGILVWQDFMFARMDYPAEDAAFLDSCEREARQVLERLSGRASLALLCGNNEVSQQAAMMGMPPDTAKNTLFDQLLRDLSARSVPDVPYIPTSPCGGAMPFYTSKGPTHYFGVGAYLRPLDDARIHRIAFAAECLAFSNVPEDSSLRHWLGDTSAPAHHPHYKERVPRDAGAGWDFADVTDHYVEQLFGVEARHQRYVDHDRYLALSRAATCEIMARVQGLWRSRESTCRGSMVWMLRDVWHGAGWGVVDASGTPKSSYYGLKRAWAPLALWIVDEGLDGLALHAENDGPLPVRAVLEVELYRKDGVIIERAKTPIELQPREQQVFSVDGLIGRFVDSSYAYRFGPPPHLVVAARLRAADEQLLAQAFHLPLGLEKTAHDVGLAATVTPMIDGKYLLTAGAERFAQFVVVEAPGYLPSDNYFHLAPKIPWRVILEPFGSKQPPRGKLRALNSTRVAPFHADEVSSKSAISARTFEDKSRDEG